MGGTARLRRHFWRLLTSGPIMKRRQALRATDPATDTMKAYAPYASQLRRLVANWPTTKPSSMALAAVLDGEAQRELRKSTNVDDLRSQGAFFTGSDLAEQLVQMGAFRFPSHRNFYDPACGAGNLLLAIARRLPTCKTLGATLRLWGQHLLGSDIHANFISACHSRLALLALSRGVRYEEVSLPSLLPRIRVQDGLAAAAYYEVADCVLMNPPFCPVQGKTEWSSGSVSAAALFLDCASQRIRKNSRILALLPEVLRSGTRYEMLRRIVQTRCKVDRVCTAGRFDENTDVDVFLLRLTRKRSSNSGNANWWSTGTKVEKLSDYFDVRVGSVVPHRHAEEGPWYPYLHAKNSTPWARLTDVDARRRFRGSVVNGPFVAIRRTSRPGDPFRAVSTIVTSQRPVAVENHLIVCIPKCGTVRRCKQLLEVFRTSAANEYFDDRIRCRHLTVTAVLECPFAT